MFQEDVQTYSLLKISNSINISRTWGERKEDPVSHAVKFEGGKLTFLSCFYASSPVIQGQLRIQHFQ